MARQYNKTRRAEAQAETRQRIVDATVDLHTEFGPAATTISMIADKAGVQRHTVYAHFPDELSLHMACSGLHIERDPPPEAAPLRAIADPRARLTAGLSGLYAWYARNAQLMANVMRDIETHEPTKRVVALRMAPLMAELEAALGDGLNAQARALLAVALSFYTWRALAEHAQIEPEANAALMANAILGAGAQPTPSRKSRPKR